LIHGRPTTTSFFRLSYRSAGVGANDFRANPPAMPKKGTEKQTDIVDPFGSFNNEQNIAFSAQLEAMKRPAPPSSATRGGMFTPHASRNLPRPRLLASPNFHFLQSPKRPDAKPSQPLLLSPLSTKGLLFPSLSRHYKTVTANLEVKWETGVALSRPNPIYLDIRPRAVRYPLIPSPPPRLD
jgi:hypothetical protein